jgi:predicted dehydrogenase
MRGALCHYLLRLFTAIISSHKGEYDMTDKTQQLRIALVGAGIFAREAHLPAWQALSDRARIVAVTARTEKSARALAAQTPGAEVVMEYDALMARDDVDAVDLMLPIDLQAEFVERALDAGKHVVSEKPAAHDVATAQRLIERWRESGVVWMVAENWRYESAFRRAAELIASGAIGAPMTAGWLLNHPVDAGNKYYNTAWRRTGAVPGGFLLDGGVHHVAALRLMLGDVESVQAVVRQVRDDLPPADTMSATLRFASGAVGSYTVTYAAPIYSASPLEVMGSEGRLRVDRGQLQLTRGEETTTEQPVDRDGVQGELEAFVDAVLDGVPHRNTPEEGLADLAVLEAMLRSGVSGRAERPGHSG